MAMDERDLHLDGNAAAGLLSEFFRGDPTMTESACDGCGAVVAVGALLAYGAPMGMILRCPRCAAIHIRAVDAGGRFVIDLRGSRCLWTNDANLAARE